MSSDSFDIERFNPKLGDKYSENLYKFLKKNVKKYGTPLVGKLSDGRHGVFWRLCKCHIEYSGAFLDSISSWGTRTEIYTWANEIVLVDDFWDRYEKSGKCAADPEHRGWGMKERWNEGADLRTCNWCGLQQKKIHWEVVVKKERWETVQSSGA